MQWTEFEDALLRVSLLQLTSKNGDDALVRMDREAIAEACRMFTYMSIHMSIHTSIHVSINVSVCMPIHTRLCSTSKHSCAASSVLSGANNKAN